MRHKKNKINLYKFKQKFTNTTNKVIFVVATVYSCSKSVKGKFFAMNNSFISYF